MLSNILYFKSKQFITEQMTYASLLCPVKFKGKKKAVERLNYAPK